MINMNQYCVIVPVYNDHQKLSSLVGQIRNLFPSLMIILVDDGSEDKVDRIEDTILLRHEKNLGKGEAIRTGIRYALTSGCDYAIFMDADLQHEPASLQDFMDIQIQTNADLVLGKRDFNFHNMPFLRYLSNTITSKLISLRTGKKISDSQCGFRLMKLLSFDFTNYKYAGFQLESEILIRCLLAEKKVKEVPIPTKYSNEKSSINYIPDTLKFIKLYFHSFFWKKERI
ncbi:MAG: glycosyltransferase family 2 protein [Candidatus Marinimicrobia bacterium]|nr:glycosyltransferase family 2 protein [Candidatus Neomarinimicrobiota bacterium]